MRIVGARHAVPCSQKKIMFKRRSIRLKDYDYTQNGAYFVTICTFQRYEWFGEIRDDSMNLNRVGRIAQDCWLQISDHFPHVELDEFVVMPNHLHGILVIMHDAGARHVVPLQSAAFAQPIAGSLPTIIRSFKAAVTKQINRSHLPSERIWQRNYYEHIIRSETSLNAIRQYIQANPAQWESDEENPRRTL